MAEVDAAINSNQVSRSNLGMFPSSSGFGHGAGSSAATFSTKRTGRIKQIKLVKKLEKEINGFEKMKNRIKNTERVQLEADNDPHHQRTIELLKSTYPQIKKTKKD